MFAAPRSHERRPHRAFALFLLNGAAAARGAAAYQGRALLVLRGQRGAEDDVWQVSQGAMVSVGALGECLLTLALCVRRPTRASSTVPLAAAVSRQPFADHVPFTVRRQTGRPRDRAAVGDDRLPEGAF